LFNLEVNLPAISIIFGTIALFFFITVESRFISNI